MVTRWRLETEGRKSGYKETAIRCGKLEGEDRREKGSVREQ
jgi:hypothetical protein